MYKRIRGTFMLTTLCLASALPACAIGTNTPASDNWQERRLLKPSASQLKQEHHGQVFIYDGLEHRKVQQAMDQHFNRIQNMMFTRIHHLPVTGSGPAEVEDDGCN